MNKEIQYNLLFDAVKELIEQSRQQIAISVNAAMSMLYWQIGKRIKTEILQNGRAGYGEQIVQSLAAQLEADYGKNNAVKTSLSATGGVR
ncbi:MAG: DUF1016 N-terminal domain-containing protein [Ignavibacteriaceae bacterium]|nr:DUF1016 N-terminal domain-containing protein [Ignavibacteriaceae bacterium]